MSRRRMCFRVRCGVGCEGVLELDVDGGRELRPGLTRTYTQMELASVS